MLRCNKKLKIKNSKFSVLVLLDTNVLISAFLGSGLCGEVLRTITDEHQLCVSRLVIDEYQQVLGQKFGVGKADLREVFMLVQQAIILPDALMGEAHAASPTNDVVILKTARDAGVDLLVTGDREMLSLATDFNVVAVTPRGFYELATQTDESYSLSPDDDTPIVSDSQGDPIRDKSFSFALKIVQLYKKLQDDREYVISKQIMRSGTSIGANIEEATAAESRRDFVHKISIASKEARETNYWLRLLMLSGLAKSAEIDPLLEESTELVRMLTAIVKTTTKGNNR